MLFLLILHYQETKKKTLHLTVFKLRSSLTLLNNMFVLSMEELYKEKTVFFIETDKDKVRGEKELAQTFS